LDGSFQGGVHRLMRRLLVEEVDEAGEVQSEARSSGRINVTSAARLSDTLPRGSNQAVRWKLSEPVAGAKSYSARWKVNAPAGKGYRIVVEQWSGGKKMAGGQRGAFDDQAVGLGAALRRTGGAERAHVRGIM
jgi:hypothetical protein